MKQKELQLPRRKIGAYLHLMVLVSSRSHQPFGRNIVVPRQRQTYPKNFTSAPESTTGSLTSYENFSRMVSSLLEDASSITLMNVATDAVLLRDYQIDFRTSMLERVPTRFPGDFA